MEIKVEQADIIEWLENYDGHKFQAVLSDPPYALISITKRFGKKGSAPAKHGTDGRFSRLSKGFMGQTWDGFESMEHYQKWVTTWAKLLIEKALYPGAVCLFYGGTRTWHRLACGLEDGGFDIYDTIMWVYGQGFPKSHNIGKSIKKSNSVFDPLVDLIVEPWNGYGTALKPAWEPIIVCRAPRGKYTFAKLALEFGTGGLNINGCRIHSDIPYDINTFDMGAKPFGNAVGESYTTHSGQKARFPANIITDWPTRYFYCAKASKKEKGKYNTHPTVKPLALNTYLATLILPPTPARILIPFSGSGSEIIGAVKAGWNEAIAIERDLEYNKIAKRRIKEALSAN